MGHHSEAFIGIDTAKLRNAMRLRRQAVRGRCGITAKWTRAEQATRTLIAKLAAKYVKLTFCYEAGPTGYGLQRLIERLGHTCFVVAPLLILDHPEQRFAPEEMPQAERQAGERIGRREQAIREALASWSLAPIVAALMAMRGIDLVAAVTMLAEIGDLSRFENPRRLMAHLSLVSVRLDRRGRQRPRAARADLRPVRNPRLGMVHQLL